MSTEEKANVLIEHLQTVLEKAENLDKENEAVADKLTPQEIRVLRTVNEQECCIMSGIANAICLSMSSVTGLIDKLVAKKLVRRDRSNADRRVVQVELTKEGRELHEAAMMRRVQFARELLKTLNSEEQDALIALFKKISSRIKAEAKPA